MIKSGHEPAAAASPMSEGGPWSNQDDDATDRSGPEGPPSPWTPPSRGDSSRPGDRSPSAIDELVRRARETFGGGLPPRADARRIWLYVVGAILLIWVATTSYHRIGPQQRGIVTFLGSYSRTLTPGANWTLPAPFESVNVVDVEEIRTIDIGSAADESEKLMLTGDQNVINLGYSVLWNIRDPKDFVFQIADPQETISEVAESAMRAVIATVTLQDAIGAGRNDIEQRVQENIQSILDSYGAGVRIQRVAIKQADPPDAVNNAFKEVSAAQQDADTYINQANAYAQQLSAQAQGEAVAFDKVYAQYKLAPEVTRRRMYYETMEKVLSGVNKTIIEADGVTPYLPLPQLQAKRVPNVTATTGDGQ